MFSADSGVLVDWVTRLLALTVVIESLEDLVRYRGFASSSLMSWPVHRLRARWLAHGRVGRVADRLLVGQRFRWIVVARLAAAVVAGSLIAGQGVHAIALAVVAVTTLAYSIRSTAGLAGSHQMTLLVATALALGAAAGSGDDAEALVLWFIALHAAVAYFVSGAAKLVSAEWRSGRALVGIFRTTGYGHAGLHRLLRPRPRLAWVMSATVIAFEVGFPVALLGPEPLTAAILGAGLAFHLANAWFMGLNLFLWSFVSTYPAVVYVSGQALG